MNDAVLPLDKKEAEAEKNSASCCHRRGRVMSMIFLILLCMVAVGFNVWKILQLERQARLDRQQTQNVIQEEKEAIDQQAKALKDLKQAHAVQSEALSEIHYLIKLALINLRFQRDFVAVKNIVEFAKQSAENLHTAAFDQIAAQLKLASDKAAELMIIDPSNFLVPLTELEARLDHFSYFQDKMLAQEKPVQEEVEAAASKEEASAPWKVSLGKIMQKIREMITLRHYENAVQTLALRPTDRPLLKIYLHTQFAYAKLALCQHPENYASSIEKLEQDVKKYFPSDQQDTEKFLQDLQKLKPVEAVEKKLNELMQQLILIEKALEVAA